MKIFFCRSSGFFVGKSIIICVQNADITVKFRIFRQKPKECDKIIRKVKIRPVSLLWIMYKKQPENAPQRRFERYFEPEKASRAYPFTLRVRHEQKCGQAIFTPKKMKIGIDERYITRYYIQYGIIRSILFSAGL